jgi:hypothetical protein
MNLRNLAWNLVASELLDNLALPLKIEAQSEIDESAQSAERSALIRAVICAILAYCSEIIVISLVNATVTRIRETLLVLLHVPTRMLLSTRKVCKILSRNFSGTRGGDRR